MDEMTLRNQAHELVEHIFCDLFPQRGLPLRQEQIQLSHRMLDTMLLGQIALCDAGTGIGKTYSYLVAGMAFALYRQNKGLEFRPLVISTSSIALQNAVKQEYLPLLSTVLLENGIINRPILAVIRKGKSHYVCEKRLRRRWEVIDLEKKNKADLKALQRLKNTIDLDQVPELSNFDKNQVCVPDRCDCKVQDCAYKRFLQYCETDAYLFQICNHNLLLADSLHRRSRKPPIMPDYCALILDEAHKLPEAARQMFGATLSAEDVQSLVYGLRQERYVLAAEYLTDAATPLMEALSAPPETDFSKYEKLLRIPYQVLLTINKQLNSVVKPRLQRAMDRLLSTMEILMEDDSFIHYAELSDNGGTLLCAAVSNLAPQLRLALWTNPQGMVLTSGTLAVGTDFTRFRQETGLSESWRVTEKVSPSPFDYQNNCLLYLPQYPPEQVGDNITGYYDALAGEIARLIAAAYGHALVLFTSYAAMAAVGHRLRKMHLRYPIYTLGRNTTHTTEQFKNNPGGVLLATGAAWEGFDFPGDCVSLLVIPRLPFNYPDSLQKKRQEGFESLGEFIKTVVVPDMQIKLRQGFGRAIRTETDSCVVAILDARAGGNGRYHEAMKKALPEVPITSDLEDVERFILERKQDAYFMVSDKTG